MSDEGPPWPSTPLLPPPHPQRSFRERLERGAVLAGMGQVYLTYYVLGVRSRRRMRPEPGS